MDINLKVKLRELRQKKGVTQEAIADHLGITQQSVGKWERGEGYPDITLLPKLALYFNVTVDELLCVDQVRIDEVIMQYQRQSKEYWHSGETEKNLELWEKAYAEFPNDCRVIEGLMLSINRKAEYPCPKGKADRIIVLGEELLHKSNDIRQKEIAIQTLCYTYDGIDKDKALYYADMGGNFYTTRAALRAHVLDGEEGVEASQRYIQALVETAAFEVVSMTNKIDFSHEEVIDAFRFAIDILKRLYSDGNMGFSSQNVSYYYMNIAREYAEMGNAESTLEALQESCKYAVMSANLGDMNYTAPMVNHLQHKEDDTSKNHKGNACNLRLENFSDTRYDFVRSDQGFKRLVRNIEKYAE